MSKSYLLVILLLFLISSCRKDDSILDSTPDLKNTWHLISEKNSVKTINKILFANTNVGWMIGSEGIVLSSTDGGYTWKEQNSHTKNSLCGINFIDEKKGWISGNKNTLIYTSNSGEEWQQIDVYEDTTKINSDIFFIDNQIGWLLTNTGNLYQTTNAGNSWDEIFVFPGAGWFKLIFFDDMNGYAMQIIGDKLMKTIDGGRSWESIDLNFPDALMGIMVRDIYFSDKLTGYFIYSWRSGGLMETATPVRKTTDGGFIWTHQDSVMYPFLNKIYFYSSECGFLIGGGDVYFTSNGGNDWNYNAELTHSGYMSDIFFYDNKVGWISSSDGTVYRYNL
jgi:photosystem II stability/assembly factor-like uncharacterized protein